MRRGALAGTGLPLAQSGGDFITRIPRVDRVLPAEAVGLAVEPGNGPTDQVAGGQA